MSSIFDIPAGLVFVLSLVTSSPSELTTTANGLNPTTSRETSDLFDAPCKQSEQSWYAALKEGAGGVAYADLAARIFQTSGGRYYVPVRGDHKKLHRLRKDTSVSCFIALSSAAANAARLNTGLGRDATLFDLYLAHVFGSDVALRFLKAKKANPAQKLVTAFPNLDVAVPNLYKKLGRKMTLAGFQKRLQRALRRAVHKKTIKKRHRKRAPAPTPRVIDAKARLAKLVHTVNLAAREVHQLGRHQIEKTDSQSQSRSIQVRFGFGLGLVRTHVLNPTASTPDTLQF